MKLLDMAKRSSKEVHEQINMDMARGTLSADQLVTQAELKGVKNIKDMVMDKSAELTKAQESLRFQESAIITKLTAGCKVEDGKYKAKHEEKVATIGRVQWKKLAMAHAPKDEIEACTKKAQSQKRTEIQLSLFE